MGEEFIAWRYASLTGLSACALELNGSGSDNLGIINTHR